MTGYGLVSTYNSEDVFRERFQEKYGQCYKIDDGFGVEVVMLKELKDKQAPNGECGLYESEDGDVPAFKCYVEEVVSDDFYFS